jgi:hypothetical protein
MQMLEYRLISSNYLAFLSLLVPVNVEQLLKSIDKSTLMPSLALCQAAHGLLCTAAFRSRSMTVTRIEGILCTT